MILSRSLFEAASVPVFVVDVDEDGNLVFADLNPVCEQTTGLRREDVVGKRSKELTGLTRAGATALIGMCHRCLQVGTPVSYTEQLELPVGVLSPKTLLIPQPTGTIKRVVGVLCDLTKPEQEIRDLQQSLDLLRAIIEAAPTAIIGLDLDGKVHAVWNPAAEKMLGWRADEVIGQILPTVSMESQAELSRFRKMVRKGMTLDGVEVWWRKQDGSPIDYSIYASPLHDGEGNVTGSIAVLVDTTDQKQAEEALRANEERLQLALEAAEMGQWEWNIETGEVDWSEQCLALYGLPPGTAMSYERFLKALHPEERESVDAALRRAVKEGTPYDEQKRTVWPDGSTHWTASRGRVFYNAAGQPMRMIGVTLDTTGWKEADQAARESGARYQAMVEAFDGLIYICSQDYRIEFMNAQLIERTGYDGTGEICYKVLHDRDSLCPWCVGERVFASETVRREVQSPKDNRWYYVVSTPIAHVDGSVSKQAMAVDITERKRGEQMMQARLRLMQYADTHSLEELLQTTLDEAEALTGSSIGFFHFLDSDQRTLTLQAWSTNTLAIMCTAEGKGLHDSIGEAGVWVDCVRERRPVIRNDYAALPHRKGTPQDHAPAERELVVPVTRGDLIVAILGVGNKPFNYDDADQNATSMLADFAWDIAERKRAEEKLLRSDQRLRLHAEESPVGFLEWDESFRAVEWNAACERIFGYTREEAIGRHAKDLILPVEVYELVDGIYQSLMNLTGGQHSINENITKDGRTITCEWFNTTLIDKDGKATGVASLCMDITERKEADEALRHSEEEKTILNQIANIFLTIPDEAMYGEVLSIVLQVMESKFGIFGYIGEKRELIIPSLTREIWEECQVADKSVVFPADTWGESLWGQAIRNRKSSISDGPFHTPEGHIHIDCFLAVPIIYGQESIGLICVANAEQSYTQEDKELLESIAAYISPILNARLERDRQEKKRKDAEKALRMLSHAVEQSPASIVITDTDGTIEYVNPKFSQITGYKREEVIGKSPRIPKSGETLAEEFQRLWDTITQGGIWRGELVNRKKGGELYWESATISPVTDARGEVQHYVAVKEDITARKRVEKALGDSEAKVHSILDNIGIGVSLISPEMEILEMNRRMREWFPHVDPEQRPFCYRALQEPPRNSACPHCPVRLTIEDGQVHEAMTKSLRANKVRSFRVLASPLLNTLGQITAAIVMKEDITEKLSLESQLQQAQKMEAIGRLAGGVAHDFNNMLGVIIGYSDMALERMHSEDPLLPNLQEVRKAAERSADLTGKLLAFSRKQTVAPKVLDLNETVAGMLKMLQRLIGEDIDLVWQPGEQVWHVRMDPSQVDQIMANLCVNARDAIMGVGKISIETRNVFVDDKYCADHPEANPGAFVLIDVSDDGCGMDKVTLSNVFEPFYTTKEIGKGTGLGLATIYGIVKQNNGFINIYSEPGLGSSFKIYLPRYDATDKERRKERPAAEVAPGNETILLVEDELAMLKMVRQILEGLGYRVLAASTPGEAIRQAQQEPGRIHLLLSDVIMPEMNGRDLARELLSLHPEMRSLFMSGYSGTVIAHRGVLEQGVSFIPKPFSPQTLATKIRQVLDGE